MSDIKKFAEQLVELTMKETKELTDHLLEEYGLHFFITTFYNSSLSSVILLQTGPQKLQLLLIFLNWYKTSKFNVADHSNNNIITKFMLSNVYVNYIAQQESQGEKHFNELIFHLNSIKDVLCDEHHPDKHGDLTPEILTINDIIKQCIANTKR